MRTRCVMGVSRHLRNASDADATAETHSLTSESGVLASQVPVDGFQIRSASRFEIDSTSLPLM